MNQYRLLLLASCLGLTMFGCHLNGESSGSNAPIQLGGGTQSADGAAETRQAAELFLDRLPRGLCEHYIRCGFGEASDLEACLADIREDIERSARTSGAVCDGMVAFYERHRQTLDACLATPTDNCQNDDLGQFCPPLEELDVASVCAQGAGNDSNQVEVGDGRIMQPCISDDGCQEGMRCLGRLAGVGGKYCSIPCQTNADCDPLIQASFFMELPEKFRNANRWNSDYLWPGVRCTELNDASTQNVGAADGRSWCAILCQENAAAGYQDNRSTVDNCSCLPNYRWADEQQTECVWNSELECSIFTPCTSTNTEARRCSEGDFRCIVGERLEGRCFDRIDGDAIEACATRCNWQCDGECLQNTCGSNSSDACTRACCTSDVPGCER